MARLRALSDGTTASIADQLAEFMVDDEAQFGAVSEPLELRQNLPILQFRDDASVGWAFGEEDLSSLLVETGRSLHQIGAGSQAVGYSITRASAEEPTVVDEFTRTPEAGQIAEAIELIEQSNVPDEYEAGLLDLRAMNFGAVVLRSDAAQPTLIVPFRVPMRQDELQIGKIYESSDFLQALKQVRSTLGTNLDDDSASEVMRAF